MSPLPPKRSSLTATQVGVYLPLSYAGRSGRPMVATILPSRVVLTTLGSFAFGWYSYPPFVSILCCLEPVSAIHRYSVPPSLTSANSVALGQAGG